MFQKSLQNDEKIQNKAKSRLKVEKFVEEMKHKGFK